MSKHEAYSASEIRSGFLVVASGLFLIGLLFMAGSSQLFQEMNTYHLHYNYISGLKQNAPVHFAGHEVGKVTGIRFAGGEDSNVEITIRLRKDAVLREDTGAFINVLGFMGETYIELTPGSRDATPLPDGGSLKGTDPVPMMEIVKQAREIAEEFEKSAAALNGLLDQTQGLLNTNEDDMNAIFSNLNVTSENLKVMTEDLKSHPWKLLRKGDDD